MVAESPHTPEDGIQRFLDDLRSYSERRGLHDRRRRTEKIVVERRRGVERRQHGDRRKRPAGSYSPGALLEIQQMLADSGVPAECPECGGQLMLGPVARSGQRAVRRVHCTGCRRSVELSAERRRQTSAS